MGMYLPGAATSSVARLQLRRAVLNGLPRVLGLGQCKRGSYTRALGQERRDLPHRISCSNGNWALERCEQGRNWVLCVSEKLREHFWFTGAFPDFKNTLVSLEQEM